MIARITRILLLLQLLIAAGVSFALVRLLHFGIPLAAMLGVGMVLLIRLTISANNFRIASRYRSTLPDHYQIDQWQACSLFAQEFYASMVSSSWTMPFLSFSKHVPEKPEGLPVLLIHGYGCNSGYWHSMSKALLRARVAHHAVDLEPVVGGIDEYVPIIRGAAERLCAELGRDRIIIVAHSMGGLAARAYLRAHGSSRIAKIITLGTPHHGTALAEFGVGLNTHQMRWSPAEQEGLCSDWLRELAADENPSMYRLFVSIYSHHDNIVSPQTSSHLEGARNIEFNAIGHVQLALDPRIQAQVISEIKNVSDRADAVHALVTLKPA